MASILVPFTADGVSVTNGDLVGNNSSPAPSISGFVDASFGGNINTTGNISAGGNIDIDGEGTIGGNLVIVGNIDFSGGGTINQITSPYGYFTGNSDGSNALYAGVPGGTIVPGAVAQFTGDANAYVQINAQNKNHGTQASMEWVVTGDLGSDTTDYLDLGFASSAWDGTQDNSLGTAVAARDGYMYVQGGGGGGNLVLGTTTSGTQIKFNVGGPNSANTVMSLTNTTLTVGNVNIMDKLDMTNGNISNIANASGNNANFAHFIGEAGNISNVQGSNVSGAVGYASVANSVAAANVSGLGNIATLNLDGSSSTVLYGNGVFAAAASGSSSNIANGNSNVNIATANGNVTIAAVGNTVMTVTGTGANITGTANISGNVALANLSFSANTGQIVFNTTAYINGSGNSVGRDGSIMLVPYTGAGSAFAGVVIGGAGRLIAPNGSVHQVFNTSDVTFQVPIKNIVGTAATSTTTGSLQISGGGGFTGNVYVGNSLVRTGAITQAAWTTSGVGLQLPTATYTDNSTAAGTQTSSYVHAMGAPALAFSNAVTVTNAATMFVAAPTAGTNATITNAYAMIANGAVQINGNLTANTNGFAIGYLNIPQVSASNTTLAATDAGKHYYSTTAGNFTLTIPNNATTSFATGTAISIVVQAAGNILVNAASGVTLYMAGNSTAANRVVGGYGMATLMKVASDTWFINGTGVS